MLITLTEEGLRMRDISKHFVLQFNESINNHIDPEKMQIFLEVIYKINQLISDKKIFKNNYEKTR